MPVLMVGYECGGEVSTQKVRAELGNNVVQECAANIAYLRDCDASLICVQKIANMEERDDSKVIVFDRGEPVEKVDPDNKEQGTETPAETETAKAKQIVQSVANQLEVTDEELDASLDSVQQSDEQEESEAEDKEELPVSVPLESVLPQKFCLVLSEAGINTLADYQQYVTGNELTALEGIGPAKAKEIHGLVESFLADLTS